MKPPTITPRRGNEAADDPEVWMADRPAESNSTVLRSLAQANREPGRGTIFAVVSLLHLIMRPLTRRDWRGQDKIPQTGGRDLRRQPHLQHRPDGPGPVPGLLRPLAAIPGQGVPVPLPVLGRILRACGQIPVQRQSAKSADALLAAVEAVHQGRAVVIYPEGTITRDPDLWPMKGKTGAARIALRTGCPVIPIGQWGAQELMYGNGDSLSPTAAAARRCG